MRWITYIGYIQYAAVTVVISTRSTLFLYHLHVNVCDDPTQRTHLNLHFTSGMVEAVLMTG